VHISLYRKPSSNTLDLLFILILYIIIIVINKPVIYTVQICLVSKNVVEHYV